MIHLVLPSFIAAFTAVAPGATAAPSETQLEAIEETEEGDEAALSLTAEVDLRARYLDEGLPWSEGPVAQPWAGLDYAPLSLWVFASIGLPHRGEAAALDELGVGLEAGWELGPFEVGTSAEGYLETGVPDAYATAELGVDMSWSHGWLRLAHEHAVDLAAAPGGYHGAARVGVAGPAGDATLESDLRTSWASAPYAAFNAGVERATVLAVGLETAVTFPLDDTFYVRPHVTLAVLPDAAVRASFGETFLTDIGLAVGGGI